MTGLISSAREGLTGLSEGFPEGEAQGIRKNSVQRWEEYKSYLCTLFYARLMSALHAIMVGHIPKPTGLKALQRTSLGGLDSLKFQPQTEQKWKAAASHTPGSRAMTGPRDEMENGK